MVAAATMSWPLHHQEHPDQPEAATEVDFDRKVYYISLSWARWRLSEKTWITGEAATRAQQERHRGGLRLARVREEAVSVPDQKPKSTESAGHQEAEAQQVAGAIWLGTNASKNHPKSPEERCTERKHALTTLRHIEVTQIRNLKTRVGIPISAAICTILDGQCAIAG